MNYAYLYGKILSIYLQCGVKSFPIDCFDIVEKLGYNIVKYSELSPQKLEACKKLSFDACLIDRTLYYNDRVMLERVHFSIMHELGHDYLNTESEEDADTFASHILAPRIIVHFLHPKTADCIHDTFGISYAASNIVLCNHKTWLLEIRQTSRRKPSDQELKICEIIGG